MINSRTIILYFFLYTKLMDVIQKSDLTEERGCLLFNFCTPDDLNNSTRIAEKQLNAPKFHSSVEKPSETKSKNTFKLIHLTDVHMDHKYSIVSETINMAIKNILVLSNQGKQ